MCVLLLLKKPLPGFSWVVAANRDEDPQRAATPPGLHLSRGVKILAPRDKKAGGTWIGINEKGLGAALTNIGSGSGGESAYSRGLLVFDALGHESLEGAAAALRARFAQVSLQPFRLVLFQGERCLLLETHKGKLQERGVEGDFLFFTHQYGPGEAEIPGLGAGKPSIGGKEVDDLFYHLQVILATGRGHETQGHGSFALCRCEGNPRTVSCTMIAIPEEMPEKLRFFHSNGDPLHSKLLDYSVLRKRLAGVR